MQFFVLRVASNKEDRVKDALQRKVKIEGVETTVGRILVPTERVRSMKGGAAHIGNFRKLIEDQPAIPLSPAWMLSYLNRSIHALSKGNIMMTYFMPSTRRR